MNIVVLAGGLSHERNVSLSSGTLVANALIKNGHRVLLLDVYEGLKLKNTTNADYENLFIGKEAKPFSYTIPDFEPNLEEIKKKNGNRDELIGENVLDICKYADIVFLALHGSDYENGKLQATFDLLNIKYTGSSYVGSQIAMDKNMSKKLLKISGIQTSNWVCFSDNIPMMSKEQLDKLSFPLVVKPCNNGSSIGVSIVNTYDELLGSIRSCKKYKDNIVIEEYIEGREFSVAILGDTVLPAIEIIPKVGFYDYKNKYKKKLTDEICPATLDIDKQKELKEIALNVHNILQLNVYSRIDFILDSKTNTFFCLEANTLPGMTPTSLVPLAAAAINMSYEDLCEKIIGLSM